MEIVGDAPPIQAMVENLKGGLYLAQRKTAEAETAFQAAIDANPDFLRPYYALARMYLQQNRQDEAVAQYRAALAKNPDQSGPHMLLGTIYEMQQQTDLAVEHYRKALSVNPDFAPAANNLAYILATRPENVDEALAFARTAKEQLPDDPRVMDTLGWVYYQKGLYDSAAAEFADSIEKLPENAVVRYHLGLALFKSGKTDEAREQLEKALSLDADFDGADEARRVLEEL